MIRIYSLTPWDLNMFIALIEPTHSFYNSTLFSATIFFYSSGKIFTVQKILWENFRILLCFYSDTFSRFHKKTFLCEILLLSCKALKIYVFAINVHKEYLLFIWILSADVKIWRLCFYVYLNKKMFYTLLFKLFFFILLKTGFRNWIFPNVMH